MRHHKAVPFRIPAYAGRTVDAAVESVAIGHPRPLYAIILDSLGEPAGKDKSAPHSPNRKPQARMDMFMDATAALARFIAATEYESLPPAAVAAAKTAILDGVANMAAGSAQELADIIGRYTRDLGGAPHCSVVGWGYRTNAPAAAFANGVFGHCLDYEIQGFPPTHGTSSCLPAALALAEQHNASGRRVIAAYALGWEVQGRLRAAAAAATTPAYHPPGLVGPLGGAAAAAKTLGLDAGQTQMALGIAASRTGGLTANTGTMVKSTHPGNAARMGAEAAILAALGYTASPHCPGIGHRLCRRPVRRQSGLGCSHRRLGRCLAIGQSRL